MSTITPQEVIRLLAKKEGPTIDFKRDLYQLDSENPKTRERQQDEMIKDILSLANGNAVFAGDKAFLILGASDDLNADGSRDLFDVGDHKLTRQRILDIVNQACEPAIEYILCDEVVVNDKRLLVLTINPTPYLHETTRRLTTPRSVYSERTAFVRYAEGITIASGKEREAIAQTKRFRFDESKNPPAVPFGAVVGGLIGGTFAYGIVKKPEAYLGHPKESGLAAGFVGGLLGASFGSLYKNFYEFRSMWNTIPSKWRLPFFGALIGLSFIATKFIYFLIGLLPKPKKPIQ